MTPQEPNYEAVSKIERDHSRFRQIVRGRIKKELRKYMTQGELIGKKGKDLVSIPLPQIDLPHFRFGRNMGGVGSGEGQVGDPVGGQPQDGNGQGEAGDQPGEHMLEVDLTLDELAKILGEELELPNISPKRSWPKRSATAPCAGKGPNRCGTSSVRL
jgi:uncharacterized protein